MIERISTAEAARRLGISQTQVRRLIDLGRLRAERLGRPQGTRLVVLWDAPAMLQDMPEVATRDATEDATSTQPPGADTNQDAPQVATHGPTEVAYLQQRVAWLEQRLERAEEERAELRRMLHMEQQSVRALAAARADAPPLEGPVASPAMPAGAPETPQKPPQRRPWWRRWFGG